MKLCIDCKFCTVSRMEHETRYENGLTYFTSTRIPAKCKHEYVANPVDGSGLEDCEKVRGYKSKCGVSGEWFEQKSYKEELDVAKAEIERLKSVGENLRKMGYEEGKKARRFVLWSP